jgi:hypothetical protein
VNVKPVDGVNDHGGADSAPSDWYVHDATPHAPGEVLLWVDPAKEK